MRLFYLAIGMMSLCVTRYGLADEVVVNSVCGGPTSASPPTPSITVSISCTTADGGVWNGTGFAAYGTLGSTITLASPSKGAGAPNTGVSVGWADSLNMPSPSLPSDTPVNLQFTYTIHGSLTYDLKSNGGVEFVLQPVLAVGGDNIINGGEAFAFCGPSSSCLGFSVTPTVSQSGTVPIDQKFTGTYATTIGQISNLSFNGGFNNNIFLGLGTATSDFLDPVSLTDIEVTNPGTGKEIAGSELIGSFGTIYPVNLAGTAVPEPRSLPILIVALIAVSVIAWRRATLSRI